MKERSISDSIEIEGKERFKKNQKTLENDKDRSKNIQKERGKNEAIQTEKMQVASQNPIQSKNK